MVTKGRQAERALVPKAEKAVVTWQGRDITVTFDDVKDRICQRATAQEVIVFLKICQSLNLNPWARDVFIVKYRDDEPASIIVATEAYLKGAEACPEFDGHQAGVILKDAAGKLEFREGALVLEEETSGLVGGWAKVYRNDRQRPFYIAVNIKECRRYTREGRPTRFWAGMPATMVRKVALSRALREAFPTRLGGMVTEAEYEETPEGELPPAYVRNGANDWKRFWARVKSDLGLTTEQARGLLQVSSIKEDLIDRGWTMEGIWDGLVAALQQRARPEVVDVQSGEIATPPDDLETELFDEDEEQPAGAAAPARPKRDPGTIRTINDLLKACNQDFQLQPKDVCRELGYGSQSEISETPAECYRRIRAARE